MDDSPTHVKNQQQQKTQVYNKIKAERSVSPVKAKRLTDNINPDELSDLESIRYNITSL
jgi:hypothetical protein